MGSILFISRRETTSPGALHSRAHRTMRKKLGARRAAPEGGGQLSTKKGGAQSRPPGPPPTRSNRSPYATPVACADNDRINHLTPLVIALPASGRAMTAGPPVEKPTARRTSSQVRSAVCPPLAVPNTVESRRHSDLLHARGLERSSGGEIRLRH